MDANAVDSRRYKVEAAFLYHFFNYITWPGYESPDALKGGTICIYGEDGVTRYLSYIQRKMAQSKRLTIDTLAPGDALDGCHMLFLRGTNPPANTPARTLTVVETQGSAGLNGMIKLLHNGEHINMSIDNDLLAAHNFSVSSRLMALAKGGKQ